MSGPARLSHRSFGLLVAGMLLAITGIGWLVTHRVARGTVIASGVFAAVALVAPGLLWPLNRFWTGVVARAIGRFNNRAVLGLVYFGVLSPWALAMRLFGRDRLGVTFDPTRQSYFEPVGRQATPDTLRDVF